MKRLFFVIGMMFLCSNLWAIIFENPPISSINNNFTVQQTLQGGAVFGTNPSTMSITGAKADFGSGQVFMRNLQVGATSQLNAQMRGTTFLGTGYTAYDSGTYDGRYIKMDITSSRACLDVTYAGGGYVPFDIQTSDIRRFRIGTDGAFYFSPTSQLTVATMTATAFTFPQNFNIIVGSVTAGALYGGNATSIVDIFGEVRASSQPYLSALCYMNISTQTVISTANTYTLLCETTTINGANWFDLQTSPNGNKTKIVFVGKNKRKISIRRTGCLEATAADTILLKLYKNGNPISGSDISIDVPNTAKDGSVPFEYIDTACSTNDYYEFYVTSESGAEIYSDKGYINITCIP